MRFHPYAYENRFWIKDRLDKMQPATVASNKAANFCSVGQTCFAPHCDAELEKVYTALKSKTLNQTGDLKFDWDLLTSLGRDRLNLKLVKQNANELHTSLELDRATMIYSDNYSVDLKFNKKITKRDYAYMVFYFPSTNLKNKNSYLITTLLVGYLLKTQRQHFLGKTKAKSICCITKDVDEASRKLLAAVFDEVSEVPLISWSDQADIKIQDVSKGNIPKTHPYANVFTKLNALNSSYKKVIILDADLYPLAFFDSLFSLETPAGCLEHRRSLENDFGSHTWKQDRSLFAAHGEKIPRLLTDLKNKTASDINASLLVLKPDGQEFNKIIQELQTPLDKWQTPIDGVWLGDFFYSFYPLPEQNYLTQRYSGEWRSIDFGFSSWCLDLFACLGFTFAGFVVKPWQIQSLKHQYSVNSEVAFSRINNEKTNRSAACQMFNYWICKMFFDYPSFIQTGMDIFVNPDPFDPWYPETSLANKKLLIHEDPKKLSFDQQLLAKLLRGESIDPLAAELQLLAKFESIQPAPILSLKTKLASAISDLITITSNSCFKSHAVAKPAYAATPKKIAGELIKRGFKVLLFDGKRFIQLITNEDKPLYAEYGKTAVCDIDTACFCKFDHLNVSYYSSYLYEFYRNEKRFTPVFTRHKKSFYLKSPHIEIFFTTAPNSIKESDPLCYEIESNIYDILKPQNILKKILRGPQKI